MAAETVSLVGSDSDEDVDWEEVDVSHESPAHRDIEITLNARPKQGKSTKKQDKLHAIRTARINCHKIHTVFLLANGQTRNHWINDPLLHARLMSLTPLSLQNDFSRIHKSFVPDQNQRGRLFEAAMSRLTEWWAQTFFHVIQSGHIRNRTFDDVQAQISGLSLEDLLDELENDEDSEIIRSSKSLMKHALMQSGSRDTAAQLFTALCRALQIPARLVVSLQSVPWQAGVGKSKFPVNKKRDNSVAASNGKGKEVVVIEDDDDDDDDDDESSEDIPISRKGKGRAKEGPFTGVGRRLGDGSTTTKGKGKRKEPPTVTLRKPRPKGRRLGSSPAPSSHLFTDPTLTPPVFWTEVFSRPDARWLPVDPIRNIVNKRKFFDPTPSSSGPSALFPTTQENRMVYVIAFEEDGYARDVTPRYAREYGAKVAKAQEAGGRVGGGGKGRKEWWERVLGIVTRPFRLLRDDLEDDELEANQLMEGMPTSMAGFKNHPLYALSRHLRRDEVIHPLTVLGKFRGEPVYPRTSVLALKSAENWMRSSGRVVRAGCQPMKMVKVRAATVGRKREVQVAEEEMRRKGGAAGGAGEGNSGTVLGEEEVMQGMYAESQTELYIPEPIVEGKIPRNNFGNIDLYVPSMLPKGAVHIPYKGAVKIARQLGFSYAEAVVGFEFRKRRATPVLQGVVVAAENEGAVLEGYWEAEQDAEKKAQAKRQERVIKQWTRLVQGLRIRQRLQAQYAGRSDASTPEVVAAVGARDQEVDTDHVPLGGGFLTAADDIVQPYHLPKTQYPEPQSSPSTPAVETVSDAVEEDEPRTILSEVVTYDLEMMDEDQDMAIESVLNPPRAGTNGVPKTMREMAEAAAARMDAKVELVVDDDKGRPSPKASSSANHTPPTNGSTRSTRASGARKRKIDGGGDANTPTKKGRGVNVDAATPSPASATRVLRPRASKSAAQMKEEKAREEAYRMAIEE